MSWIIPEKSIITNKKWSVIKCKLQEKKKDNYSDNVSYKELRRKGTLQLPYKNKELEQMCKDISIPKSLHYYLTTISKEILCGTYPYVFDGCCDSKEECNIPSTDDYIDVDDVFDRGIFHVPVVKIGHDDDFCTMMIIRGNHYGSIWRYDGECYSKMHDNFQEYLIKTILEK